MKHAQLDQLKIVDLTHPLSTRVPTWNGSCGFCLEIKKDYDQVFRVQQMKMHAGVGTHMDAPSHRIQGGISIADIPVEQLIAPICVIDVSKKAGPDYEISLQDIKDHEADHGMIPPRALVIAFTGWSRFWEDSDAYRNMDADGQMHFPAFSSESAQFLVDRNVSGIAIDTLSPDCLDLDFPVHQIVLGAGKYIIENIADCSQIPIRGSYAVALPLRVENGTESPIRIIALVPSLESISERNGISFLSKTDRKVYSVGISTGGLAEIKMAQSDKLRHVIATTIDPAGAEYAKQSIEKRGFSDRIEVKIEDVSQPLLYPDGYFDYVYARLVLHYLSKQQLTAALKELYRILRKDGKIFVVVRSVDCPEAQDKSARFDSSTGLTTYTSEGRSYSRYYHSQESIQRHLSQAGFRCQHTAAYQEQLCVDFQRSKLANHIDSLIEVLAVK